MSEDFVERGHRWIVRQTRPVTETDSTLSADVRAPLVGRARSRRDIARVIVFIQAALLGIVGLLYVAGHAEPYVDALSLIGAGILFWGAQRMGTDAPIYISGRGDEAGQRRVPWDWTDFLMFWPGAFIAASLLVSIAVPIADAATNGVDPTVRTAAESFVQQAAFYGGALFNIYVLVGLRRGGTLYHVGWRRFSWWWIPIAVIAVVATLEIADVLQALSQHLFPGAHNTQCQAVQHDYSHFLVLAVIVVCVIAPLSEETIFRGFVYGWLHRVMPAGFAVLVSGAIFASLHGVVLLLIPLWAVGIILAVVFQSSRSLWPGALTHALFNLPGIIAILSSPTC